MAIAYDSSSSGYTASGSSLTFSHTCSGSNRILFVGVGPYSAGSTITGVTYNGVSMTLIATSGASAVGGQHALMYYLINPTSGANNVVVSASSSIKIAAVSASYTGALQTGQPDSSATNNDPGPGNVTTLTGSTTVASSACWTVMCGFNDNEQALSAGSGSTLRIDGTHGNAMFDSSKEVPLGSYSMTYTGGSAHYCLVIASFKPATTNGIALDNYINEQTQSSGVGTTQTVSYTCSGSNRALVVAVQKQSSNTCSGVTYNGVAMTLISQGKGNSSGSTTNGYLFYLSNPASGANNIVATFNSATGVSTITAASYTGVKQTGQPEADGTNSSASTTSLSVSATVTSPNSWLVGQSFSQNNMSAGSGTIIRSSVSTTDSIIDSNGTVGTGSQSLTVTQSSGYMNLYAIVLAPYVVTSGNFLMCM